MNKNLYEILELDKSATAEEIKSAYKKLAMKYHPDRNQGSLESEEKFKEIAGAYEILSDSQKKQNYDTFGSTDPRQQASGGFNFNMDDIFSQFGDIFGSAFGQKRVRKGQDMRLKITLTLHEIMFGVDKKIKYIRPTKCKGCHGTGGSDTTVCRTCSGTGQRVMVQHTPFGRIQQTTTCGDCQGEGRKIKNICNDCSGEGTSITEEVVDIKIPPGALPGMQLNMPGYGAFIRDGQPGDLFIIIEEQPDQSLRRDGTNLIYDLRITISEAVLGATKEITTPRSSVVVTIEPGTPSEHHVLIRGKGLPNLSSNGNVNGWGDLIVRVIISIPKVLTTEQREIFEKLKNL
jgi:molecular chaperone DnaJ